jgi:Escherichia/Staphylococcus phage prohead protease
MADISTAQANDLPDSAFAYIEPGGKKDDSGRTTPRSLRHFPIHDAAHTRNALSRAPQSPFGEKAMPKIMAAAKRFNIHVGEHSMLQDEEMRELRVTSVYRDLFQPLEIRDKDGSDDHPAGRWIGGYASVFMPRVSRNLGGFIEQVASTAFDDMRMAGWRGRDGQGVVCRYNHDSNMVLGTSEARTLELTIDRTGLDYAVLPPPSRTDIRELVERGDIRYSSFAFRVLPGGDEWDTSEQMFPRRTLHAVELIDVAPVLNPGYPDATAAVRATNAALRSLAEWAQASVDEIRALAENDELRKLFTRTSSPKPAGMPSVERPAPRTLFGPLAASLLLRKKHDPYDDSA